MKIEDILKQMTLREKIALTSGRSFWRTKGMKKYGVPEVFLSDGPHGLRKQERKNDMLGVGPSRPATCFPTAVTLAGSWDPELAARVGEAVAEEAEEFGVGVVLGPGVNIKRNPLCGRNFEYLSEDPFLSGKLAASFIAAAQKNGVGTSLKHFACNNQEYKRFNSDSVLDERTLRELYLPAFEIAVREGKPATVMCAYNLINGEHCSDSRRLLTGILREEWGFEGLVVTDWGALNDRTAAFRAGCDLVMPGGSAYQEREARKAVLRGELPESAVEESAARVLRLAFRAQKALAAPRKADWEGHHALAARAAAEGAVLLKNEGILPLAPGEKAVLIGSMAREMRHQGAGSSRISPTQLVSPLDVMGELPFAEGCMPRGETSEELLREAVQLAGRAETAVVFAGLPDCCESEGFDRADMRMPEGHCRLIEAVAAANPRTVVVLLCGSPVETPWADRVGAILYMGLPGQAGGEAAAGLLYGRINPGGRLAESWPIRYEDCPSAGCWGQKDAEYREGLYVGYRYYDKAGVPVRWPFGYGLSYTRFSYSRLEAAADGVSVTVANIGERAGAEVAQLYISPPEGGLHRPVRELKGFRKVFLQPGEKKRVFFPLDARSFALWDGEWKVPGGEYRVSVGGLSAPVCLPGEPVPAPFWQAGSWYERPAGFPLKEDWEAMLGREHRPVSPEQGQYTMDSTVLEMKDGSLLMRLLYWGMEKTLRLGFRGKEDPDGSDFRMAMASTVDSPLRFMQQLSGIRGGLFRLLLAAANARPGSRLRQWFGRTPRQ